MQPCPAPTEPSTRARPWHQRVLVATWVALGLWAASPPAQASEAPPTVSLHFARDGTLDLSPWKGKVVYLDFFASWCGPCRQSFPWMMAVQRRFKDQGLVVLAVNVDKDRALADKFLQQFHPDFAVAFDSEGRVAEQMKVAGMPSSVIFDRDGHARFTHTGFRLDQRLVLEDELGALLHGTRP